MITEIVQALGEADCRSHAIHTVHIDRLDHSELFEGRLSVNQQ